MRNEKSESGNPIPGYGSRHRKEWSDTGAAIFVVTITACMAAVPLIGNGYFYFSDDFQMMIMPVMLEIARQVTEWQMPFVTGRSWLGGAISAEYQYAIWNPVSVSLYVLMDRFGRLDKVLCPRRPRRQHPGPLLNRPFRSARNRAGGLRPREWRLRSRPRKRAACQRRGSGPGL